MLDVYVDGRYQANVVMETMQLVLSHFKSVYRFRCVVNSKWQSV